MISRQCPGFYLVPSHHTMADIVVTTSKDAPDRPAAKAIDTWFEICIKCPGCGEVERYMTTNHRTKPGDSLVDDFTDKCYSCDKYYILVSGSPDYIYGPWARDGTAKLDKKDYRDPPV